MKKSENPKKTNEGGGKGAKITRNRKGDLEATKPKDFYRTPELQAGERKAKSKKLDKTFTGAPAPRTGGKQAIIAKSGSVKGGSKAQLKQSKKRVKNTQASAQAKRSAKRLY